MPELTREERLAAAFVDLADTLVRDFDVIGFLHSLTEHCVDLLDVAAAGVLLGTPSGPVVEAAASDERTRKLELAGVEWDEGPCHDCYHSGAPLSEVPLDTDEARARWPRFAPRALELGHVSVVAAPLRMHGQVIGALNLFRDRPGPLEAGQVSLAQAMADTAAIGILQQRAVHASMSVTVQLQHALDSRIIIEQANGFLAHRHRTGAEEAFALLRRHAERHQLGLTDLAQQVMDGTADPTLLGPTRA
ncbi:GAF and ANTAR domain-containing protein [Streptomyces sp. H27-D2]|uniref:GAF and ANTAR domain-containing protein n=1 Tax=Streptomyces sp. H27-D2 TaxID=3046304 RepID=UPI002DBE3143|nr:GAF and ANTAR domain-containing protein [Streptomyces sp. H27-D2]MEC4020764.1 GAF and ANTAR domain-containing protein [Streptomyces sp. H27-D2]